MNKKNKESRLQKLSNAILHIVSNWQMYIGIFCIMLGITGIGLALVFACC